MSRVNRHTLRAAWWTLRALRSARRQLSDRPFDEIVLPPVPRLQAGAGRGVAAVLRRRSDTCLVRATVRQAWFGSQGMPRDLVIGVTAPQRGFKAHAWLDGDTPCHEDQFHELVRRPAPAPSPPAGP